MTTKVTSPLINTLATSQLTGTITSAQIASQTDPSWLTLSRAVPTGALLMWPVASAPSGWLICNGQAVSRTTYSALFSLFGITFGAGDGSNTFNLPNYTDRMPIGSGNLYNVAATGGSKDAIVVSHTHTATVTDPGHAHTWNYLGMNGTQTGGGSYAEGSGRSQAVNSATTGITVSNSTEGSSGTNANLPPYLGIFFIIKT